MWKDVLVHVDGSQGGRNRATYSLMLAQRFGAHLTGLYVASECDVPPVFKPTKIRAVEDYLDERAREDAIISEKYFREATRGAPDTEWLTLQGDLLEHLRRQARYSDLVVVGQYETLGSPEAHPLTLAAALVHRCGRPLLVLPQGSREFFERLRVVIAWDGDLHTVRAIHDALPLLAIAAKVSLLTVSPEQEDFLKEEVTLDQLTAHLDRHGVKVKDRQVIQGGGTQSQTIRQHLASGEFDLVVMGAFTHPPWVEVLFGGVTQDSLLESRIPVLISH